MMFDPSRSPVIDVTAKMLDIAPAQQSNIPEKFAKPVGKPQIDSEKANKAEMTRKGEAIANLLMQECEGQAGKLKRFLVDISTLTYEGRRGFRSAITEALSHHRAMLETLKGTPEHASYRRMVASATVRTSEAVTFSKAVDAGFQPDLANESYHSLIGGARDVLTAESSTGPTQKKKRGRPAKSFIDKLKEFMIENAETDANVSAACVFVTELAKVKGIKWEI